jgi:WD40 repeat protein/serine/threonine protein kinase
MSKLKIFLLGTPQLEIDNTPIDLERRKALALLAYLAVTEKSHSRESLAALFWPEADQNRARTTLRHNLWTLNKALGDVWLDISREIIGLATIEPDSNLDLWIDVSQFRHELAACQTHDHTEDTVCPDCLPHLREAVFLYRDDFLTGFTLRDSPEFDEWQRVQTETLRRELAEALERLVRGQSAQEDFKAAMPYAQRWLALDPLQEPAHRQLMELYARSGQRAAALHQYAECERMLHEEFGVPPSLETTALAERIRLETDGQQGQLIKSYELHELIGEGGFGEVYRAYQPQVRREVAIKVILPQYANQPDFIRRFEAEAQLVAQLEHPHIVPLYDFWREPDGAYLVMRWLRGGSLEEALQAGLWQPQATAQLLDQIAAALMLAHQRGIVHRDLKPANILLDEDGQAYLSDFGIAKEVTAPASKSEAGYVLASPAYASPETLNAEPLTPQTDIYSLGVILYETLTGGHPFPDTTPPMMIIKHQSEPLPSLLDARPDLPAVLDDVIKQATAKKPANRYADVLSLARDFRRALGSDQVPVTALPDESTPLLVPNPYKGLHAFQEGDAADFFGRDTLVDQLLIRLTLNRPTQRQPFDYAQDKSPTTNPSTMLRTGLHNFLAIVGPSGSGKSSLVKAGLIPALRQNSIPGSQDWFIVDMTPGRHPLKALETALLRVAINPPPNLLDQLRSDERGLLRVIKRLLPDKETRLLLVIDQFEEVFTLVDDEAARSHFLASLYTAVTEPGSPLQVVITLRADFYDRPLLYPGFGNLLRQRMETVLPLSSEQLEKAIAGPAQRVGAALETGLIPLIVSDVQEQPGTLPLMQYALTELYKRRKGRRLTLEGYQASGGVFGALARRADELYTGLDDAGRATTRRLFLRLVTVGEATADTRRRVLRSELTSLDGPGEPNSQSEIDGWLIDSIIDTFGQHRLLTFDRDPVTRGPTVEVAHEALIREWDRLRQWLDEDREFLMWQQRLRAGLHQWQASKQDEGALLRGAPLTEAENWLNQRRTDLNEAEREFIQASQAVWERQTAEREAQRQRELEAAQKLAEAEKQRAEVQTRANKRLRWSLIGLTAFLLVAIGAAFFAMRETQRAEQQTRLTTARELAGAALNNLEIDPERSMLLALRAVATTYDHDETVTREAENALHRAVSASRVRLTLGGDAGPVGDLKISPDGTRLATGSFEGIGRVWDIATGELLLTLTGHEAFLFDFVFSPDQTRLATASYDGTAKVWDASTGQELFTLTSHSGEVNRIAISPDGTRLATASFDGTVKVWDARTGQELFTLTSHDNEVWDVNFSPDGRRLATGSVDGTARLWDAANGRELMVLRGHTGFVGTVAFSPDGKYLATSSEDRTAKVWDLATGQALLTLGGYPSEVMYVRFSPDGTLLATATAATAKLWQLEADGDTLVSAREWLTLAGHAGFVLGIDFTPDGTQLATGSFDGTARVWSLLPEHELLHLVGHQAEVFGVAFSPDGTRLASASFDGTAKVWDASTGQELLSLTGHAGRVYSVGFSPDGTRLATSGHDGTAKVWDATSGEELLTLSGHEPGSISASLEGAIDVAFSPDGTRLATAGSDATAKVWDAATGQELFTLSGHHKPETAFLFDGVVSVAFSGDGTKLATAGVDGTARVWDASDGHELLNLAGDIGILSDMALSPDGTTLATGSWDSGLAQVWNISTAPETGAASGQELLTLPAGTSVNSVALSVADGAVRLATSYDDGTARIWDVTNGQEWLNLLDPGSGSIYSIAFSPDGTRLATGSRDGQVRLYVLPLEELVDLAQSRLTRTWTTEECQQFLHLAECPEEP